ncbi:PDZ domain-containing protein [Paenibacillus sp.]|uniref:PDZ domain-containing protein n=1 Tax=Paenibacillus sp. TaxID=58172 RepID=UPI002810DA60|nr:PDZ domain-containing protein [Paenibacillus sp.]
MEVLNEWLRAFGTLWTSPFYYLALLFIALHARKQTVIERKLFSVKLHSWWSEWWRMLLWGAAVGASVSVVFLFLGAKLSIPALLLLWVLAVLLSFARVRYFCFAYAAGVLGLLQAAVGWIDAATLPPTAATLVFEVQSVHLPSVLALVGVLHLAEAALVYKMAGRLATPLFFEGKRGKTVGGYQLQGFWPVPLLLLTPMAAGAGIEGALPWPTLFGGDLGSAGWGALAFPVLVGFHSLSLTRLPQNKARVSAFRLGGYGLAVTALGIVVYFVPTWWAAVAAALLCFALHELIVALDRRGEALASPYFVHDARGLKVLAVVPGSPAAELGIEPGHVLRKVNGIPVRDRAELHAAMRMNAAFMKLEVLNHAGESRFLQRAVYANEHHQLGIVLCPDEHALYVVEFEEGGLFSFLKSRRSSSGGMAGNGGGERLALPAPSSETTLRL